jgi:hypothetical protein
VFDLRYHVASLAAVFLALVIGIVVGVGISSGGFVEDSERKLLNDRIAELQNRVDTLTARTGDLARGQRATQTFVDDTYPALMAERLHGVRVALVFVGSVDGRTRSLVERTLSDADGPEPVRLRALKVPLEPRALARALSRRPALARYAGDPKLEDLGRRLAQELVAGGDAPVWKATSQQLAEEESGNGRPPVDAVVVSRTVEPQRGRTARFLRGLYRGLASAGIPAIGVERTGAKGSAVEAFARDGLATVDNLDAPTGRLALALLLGGARPGRYGVKATAHDGALPPVKPVEVATLTSG